jgi:Cu/Ag efflux pump CusA
MLYTAVKAKADYIDINNFNDIADTPLRGLTAESESSRLTIPTPITVDTTKYREYTKSFSKYAIEYLHIIFNNSTQ